MRNRKTDEFGNWLAYETEEEKKWAKILLEKTAIDSCYRAPEYPEDEREHGSLFTYYPIDIKWIERAPFLGSFSSIAIKYKMGIKSESS